MEARLLARLRGLTRTVGRFVLTLWRGRLSRNSFLALLQGVTGVVVTFASYRLLLISHGTEALGLWSLVVGVIAFARLADISGGSALSRLMSAGAMADTTRSREEIRRAFADTVTVLTASIYGIVLALAYFPAKAVIAFSVPEEFSRTGQQLTSVLIIAMFVTVLGRTTGSALDGIQRADLRVFAEIASLIFYLALSLVLVPEMGVLGLGLAQLAQAIVLLVCARIFLVWQLPGLSLLPMQFCWRDMGESASYGFRLQANTVAALIFDPVVRLLVNHYAGLSTLGLLDVALRLVGQTREMLMSGLGPLVPEFSRLDGESGREDRIRLLEKVMQVVGWASAALLISVCLAAPVLSLLLFGKVDSWFLVMVATLVPSSALFSMARPIDLYARGTGHLRWNIASNIAIAVAASGTVVGIGEAGFGDWAVCGVAIGIAVGAIVNIAGNLTAFGLPSARIFPTTQTVAQLCIAVFAALALAGFALAHAS